MSSFTDCLIVSPLPDGSRWVIRKEFYYYVSDKNSEDIVTVPSGFVTDFASVPRVFWKILPKWGKYGNAAVIHDYLYVTKERSRKESDKIFLDGMAVLGVPKWKRYAMYYSVRTFGALSYGESGLFLKVEEEKEEINKINLINYVI
jgi:hypothetical protein